MIKFPFRFLYSQISVSNLLVRQLILESIEQHNSIQGNQTESKAVEQQYQANKALCLCNLKAQQNI